MNNDRLNLGVVVPPGDDPVVPLDNIIPAYQQSCHCCSGGDDQDDFKRSMIQTVNAAPGGVIGDEIGETRKMLEGQATRSQGSMIAGVRFEDDAAERAADADTHHARKLDVLAKGGAKAFEALGISVPSAIAAAVAIAVAVAAYVKRAEIMAMVSSLRSSVTAALSPAQTEPAMGESVAMMAPADPVGSLATSSMTSPMGMANIIGR